MRTYDRNCQFCDFFVQGTTEDGELAEYGDCRRYAPRPVLSESSSVDVMFVTYPSVFGDEFCGEFEKDQER